MRTPLTRTLIAMCGRFALTTPPADLASLFETDTVLASGPPSYNIAPTDDVTVVRQPAPGRRDLDRMRWGLIPAWAEDPGSLPLMINARSETLVDRPAFRDPYQFRRCLVPADGFFEWRQESGLRRPYFVRSKDGQPLALAGLWDRFEDRDGPVMDSCAIVTTDANPLLAPLHHRMPAVLPRDVWALWLDPEVSDPDRLGPLLRPLPSDALELFAVDPRVNKVSFNEPGAVEPRRPAVRTESDWTHQPDPGPAQLDLL